MARLILDTSVLVAAERGRRPLTAIAGDEDDVALAAISIAELYLGMHLGGEDRRVRRESFINEVMAIFAIESYDVAVAREHGELLAETRRSGRPRGAHDLMIAATARARARTVVTVDASGFEGLSGVVFRAL